jgi:23S rRNA G2445 N2-methylase RlmL
MKMPAIDSLRLVGIPGTNKVMAGELSRLAARAGLRRSVLPKKAGTGALVFPFDARLALHAVGYHRTSSRVLWDLFASRAERLEPLHDEIATAVAADRRAWMWDGARITVRARNVGGFPASVGQLLGAVKAAVIDGAARRGARLLFDPDRPDLLLALRRHDDELTVSLDLAGRAMHQRGYRRAGGGGEAPLRENLAAVLLMLTRWDARCQPLIDPMAGSGTIPIEAALIGRGEPLWRGDELPALARVPAFATHGLTRPGEDALFADTRPVVLAGEIHTPALAALRENVSAAGCSEWVTAHHGDFRQLDPERARRDLARRGWSRGAGVILVNPPYGERLSSGDEEQLYRDLGRWCRQFRGWRAGVLCAHPGFAAAFGGRARVKKPLHNGAQAAYFYLYEL